MADASKRTPTADTTRIRLRAGLDRARQRCDALFSVLTPHQPVRFEYNAVLSRCDKRGFPYPFLLDSVRCHA
ncbi:hypothetical protein G3N95_11065 [Paraburkholderia sp. Tr-20389]|uniref:hypothetical protein n=1 Tax=Paraburkholderia sp. Tr-20389 TaxID=2703903 RepID=UPI001980B978|nr:hypothetical protein [Paraburkholderia sp. Tr-20389]MBN3753481.1 hypothetical protein [Paraburkholderia sp. Tr-20389]